MIRFVKEPPGKLRRHYKNGEAASLGPITESLLIKHGQAVEIHKETIESNAGGLQSNDSKPKPGKVKSKDQKR